MKMTKYLGKIDSVHFGFNRDRPFLFGLELTFKFDGNSYVTSVKDTVNISEECKWDTLERRKGITECIDRIAKIMRDANVNDVKDLKNTPVEITLDGNLFKDYRILTEVI